MTSGLNGNQTAIADHLDGSLAAGNGHDPLLLALANTPTLSGYRSELNELSPEVYLDTEIATLFSSLNFANSLLSCRTRDGAYAIINEGQCVWAQVQGDFLNRSATSQNFGFQDDRGERRWRRPDRTGTVLALGSRRKLSARRSRGRLQRVEPWRQRLRRRGAQV